MWTISWAWCTSRICLFVEKGEAEFRKMEQKALQELSHVEKVVISTGGGAPCFFDNMELMNNTGATVYIMASPEELSRRLLASKTVRPLIVGKSPEELLAFIAKHLAQRETFYKKAHLVCETTQLISKQEVHLTAENIVRQLKKYSL